MKALFIPDYSPRNPYQQLLASALRARGVAVASAMPSGPLPLLDSVKQSQFPDVVHLHWAWPLVAGTTRHRTRLHIARLAGELAALRSMGTTVVWTVHNLLDHEREQPDLDVATGRLIVHMC